MSLRDIALLFACWTATHFVILISFDNAILVIGLSSLSSWDQGVPTQYYIFLMTILEIICHLIGTIFLFIGIYGEIATSFFLGIVFSSIYAYLNFYMVYLPVMQIIFTYYGLKYYEVLKEEVK